MVKSGLVAAAAMMFAGPAFAVTTPVDLSGWTAEGYAGSFNWVLQPGNNAVLQTVNGLPTVFYGPGNAQGRQLSGTIRVGERGDNDYIGFVLGFQPGDLASASTDFILVDWKQGNQSFGSYGFAPRGLAIHQVSAGLGDNAGPWSKAPGFGVTTLARGANLSDTGWLDNTEYSFDLVFTSSNIQVFVDDVLEIDIEGSFANGTFGFYNYSQAQVLYAGLEETILPPPPPPPGGGTGAVPEPATWAMLIAGFGLVGAVARRRRGLAITSV